MKKFYSVAALYLIFSQTNAQTATNLPLVNNVKTIADTSINKTDKNGLKQGLWKETSGNVKKTVRLKNPMAEIRVFFLVIFL